MSDGGARGACQARLSPAEDDDGYRVLIDHVWPRGVLRERAHLDAWARELAPSEAAR